MSQEAMPVRALAVLVACLGLWIGAKSATAYLSYAPFNGAFERCDERGVPYNWSLTATPSADGLRTEAKLVGEAWKGDKALYVGSLGTGSASANLEMNIENNLLRMLYIGTAEFHYKVLSSGASCSNLVFQLDLMDEQGKIVAGTSFSPSPEQIGDGLWHLHRFLVDIRQSRTARSIVLSFGVNPGANKAPGAWIVDELQIYETPASLALGTLRCENALVGIGETFRIGFNTTNTGGAFFYNFNSNLTLTDGLRLANGTNTQTLGVVEPDLTYDVQWTVIATKPGVYCLTAQCWSPDNLTFLPPPMLALVASADYSHPVARPDRSRGSVSGQEAVIENPHIRLAFPLTEQGYGMFTIQCWDGSWKDMGISMPIGHALYLDDHGKERLILLIPDSCDFGATQSGAWLALTGSVIDGDGVIWAADYRFDLGHASPFVGLAFSVKTSRERLLLRLSSPQILAGEGSFAADRDAGLFCGLEYLLAGERSSGTDFAWPPVNLRVVPHPLKVTIPLMVVEHDQASIALSWDPLEKWDGVNAMMSAKYVSPNWIHDQKNHMMALFVPTIPEWVSENQDKAFRPYNLTGSVTMRSEIFAQAGVDAVGVVLWWLDEHGIPEPPEQPRSFLETTDLNTLCYKDICWVPAAKAWKHTHLNDPGWIFYDPMVALSLWHYSALTTNHTLRDEIREQVLEALAATGGWGVDLDLALHLGEMDKALTAGYGLVQSLADSQSNDGSWPFTPNKQQEQLGRPGDTSSGWTASKARVLLKFGRITGDATAIQAGLKALEYLDGQTRPEGAQTWELQLHVPDVLASAYVTECYLEAFRITGHPRYLDRAKYWAATGLPFIYLWNPPDRPIMIYGSIPVFGATWYTGAWFGVIVQWNGLDYAYRLYDLSKYDDSLPWMALAEGITICGMQMQRYPGGPHEEVAGMYPDAYSAVKGTDQYYFDINPRYISLCAFALMGHDQTAQTEMIRFDEQTIHVSTVGKLGAPTWHDDSLEFQVEYAPGDTSYALIGGVSRPSRITINGLVLDETSDLSAAAQGWSYRTEGILVFKMIHLDRDTVRIWGIAPQPNRRVSSEPVWEFDLLDSEGWANTNMLLPFALGNGTLFTRSTGSDPYMMGPTLDLAATGDAVATIRMRTTAGTHAQIFWTRKDSHSFSESKSMSFSIEPDGEWHEYRVAVGLSLEWTGTIRQIRFDPSNAPDAQIWIDYIRIDEMTAVLALALLPTAIAGRKRRVRRFAFPDRRGSLGMTRETPAPVRDQPQAASL